MELVGDKERRWLKENLVLPRKVGRINDLKSWWGKLEFLIDKKIMTKFFKIKKK